MGANPGADGNTTGFRHPRTEFVRNIRAIEDELIHKHVLGQRNWEEILRTVFREEYPYDDAHLDAMVQTGMKRIEQGYVPSCVMERYHEYRAFHRRCALK